MRRSNPVSKARAPIALLSLGIVTAACASGPRLILGQPIRKEVAVVVHASKDTDGDRFGGIGTLVETVTEGLTDRGIANQLYTADDDHPAAPRIEIWVSKWTDGNGGLRAAGRVVGVPAGAVGAAMQYAGYGQYEVTVRIFREGDVQPICARTHAGMVNPADAGDAVSTGEILGKWVLSDALRDEPKCPTSAPHFRGNVR